MNEDYPPPVGPAYIPSPNSYVYPVTVDGRRIEKPQDGTVYMFDCFRDGFESGFCDEHGRIYTRECSWGQPTYRRKPGNKPYCRFDSRPWASPIPRALASFAKAPESKNAQDAVIFASMIIESRMERKADPAYQAAKEQRRDVGVKAASGVGAALIGFWHGLSGKK